MKPRPPLVVSAAVTLALVLGTPAAPRAGSTLWFVAGSLGSDLNPCNAPNLPCDTIDAAIARAQPGDQIDVTGGGVYTSTDLFQVVHVDKSLFISGGWDATFTQRPYFTVIDGEHSRRGITIEPGAVLDLEQVAVVFGDAGIGGGIYVGGGLFGRRLLIALNHALDGGGIYFNGRTGEEMFVNASALVGNLYHFRGGGLFVAGYRVIDPIDNTTNEALLFNVTVSNNLSVNDSDAQDHGTPNGGGGVYLEQGFLDAVESTFAENTIWDGHKFTQNQAGVFGDSLSGGFFEDTLVADGCHVPNGVQFESLGNNVERGFTCFFVHPGDHTNINPLIYPPSVNPGPQTTITHALAPNSPAIDNGRPTWCPGVDQRGIARPQGAFCDIGAYERAPGDPPMGFITHPGNGFADGERCRPLEWNPTGRERPNSCRVEIEVLVREAIRRGFPPVTAPPAPR